MSRPVALGSSVPQWPTFLWKLAANRGYDIVGSGPNWFVNQQRAVQGAELCIMNQGAELSAFRMAAITRR